MVPQTSQLTTHNAASPIRIPPARIAKMMPLTDRRPSLSLLSQRLPAHEPLQGSTSSHPVPHSSSMP